MPFLSAKNISKRYDTGQGPFFALRRCTLSFPSKGLIAIKGKSGSGKSTLLNILSGIERPTTGNVRFLGESMNGKGPMLGHRAAMVFQHYNLIDGESVLYNVALPSLMAGRGRGKAKELIQRFGLQRHMHKDVSLLSGGEKQRVAICRALVNDPRVVFADEPTGALDERNSEEVMKALRDIAKDRLVIMVSHNEELIRRYAEETIVIADGVVKNPLRCAGKPLRDKRRRRYSSSWVGRFIFRNIKRNLLKDTMCFLAGATGFLAAILSVGFFDGNGPAFEREQAKSLLFEYAAVSEKTVIEIPGSNLTLTKKTKPSPELSQALLVDLGEAKAVDDYGYFFPSSMAFQVENEPMEPAAFYPVEDITLSQSHFDLLVAGEYPAGSAFDECLVNLEFLHKYGEDILGKTMRVAARSTVTYEGKQNEVFVDASLRIVGAVKEFAFLNSPHVYYSYSALSQSLEDIDVEGTQGDVISVKDLVASASPDSPYGNYGQLLFLGSEASVKRLYALLDEGEETLDIVSPSYSLRASFFGLSNAFVASLGLFVGVAVIGLALILGMASLSSFIAGRKESAVLTVLGARHLDIVLIYVLESVFLCVSSGAVSLGISPLLQALLNVLLQQKFDVSGLIAVPFQRFLGIPYLVVWGVVAFSLSLAVIASLIPMIVNRRLPLVEELRDE